MLNLKSIGIGMVAGMILLLASGWVIHTLEAGSFQTTTLVVDDEIYLVTTNTKTSVVRVHHIVDFGKPKLHTREPFKYERCMFPKVKGK